MPKPRKGRQQLIETMNRVRGMLVHYRMTAPDRVIVDTTLRELDDVEAMIAECYAAREAGKEGGG